MAEVTDTLERRDALRAIAAILRGDGIEVDLDVVPARWSIGGAHEFVIPGADPKRRLKARFRVTAGPVEDVEQDLVALFETPEGLGRNEIKALAKRVKAAIKGGGHIEEGKARIDAWIDSVAERAAAFGNSWRPQAFSDDLARVLGFGGRTPRLETLLDAVEEAFGTARPASASGFAATCWKQQAASASISTASPPPGR